MATMLISENSVIK